MNYVLGFLFSKQGDKVWLIRKNKPEWQAGKLNGIGGKIETSETIGEAMIREFREEASLTINDWKWFATLSGTDYRVYCFCAYSDEEATTMTDEHVKLCYTASLPSNIIPNISWLVPMALSFKQGETVERFFINDILPDKNLSKQ